MLSIDSSFLDFKQLDLLALRETAVHRLDPRAKVLTTFCFIVIVVSFDKYEVAALLPFLIYPVVLIALGNLPPGYLLRKIMIIIPFALMIGLFNPVFDRQVMMQVGSINIWGGWLSCSSILLRAILTASAVLVLVATTGFPAICAALQKLRMPQVFAVQLLFLYRYIFVLAEEGVRIARARQLRTLGRRGLGIRQFASLTGHLLLRTWERAERVHMAMLARGFSGEVHAPGRQIRFGSKDLLFACSWIAVFILFRMHNAPQLLGNLITGNMQ